MDKYSRLSSIGFKLAAMALAIGAAGSAMAANNATATATSTVITPIAISKAADLAFGSISVGAGGGTVTVATDGARTKTGDVFLAGGATGTAAKFDVTGSGTMTYSITLGGDTSLSDGTNTMTFARVSDLTGAGATSGNVTSGALTAGAQSIYVGGVLTVAANQPAGAYTGNISATVDYN
ncbi:DUF4402 domain-containing protein [Massilia aerilata]|uniref:DUF4402 domain-containing protein n=1 Tax=Massilia aerilata TaxID=453817 RepID=A0ABW0S4T9_9BURK